MNPENPRFDWILQIKSKSGFLRFMIQAFFLGKDPKKVHLSSGLPCDILVSPYFRSILRDKTFDRGKENSGDFSLCIIGKFSSKVQNEI